MNETTHMAGPSNSSPPSPVKKFTRAVLLSSSKGVMLRNFCREYTKLVNAQFPWRELGYGCPLDLLQAMDDVVRVEKALEGTVTLFGIGSEQMFMPSWVKKAQGLTKPSVTLTTLTPTYNHYFMATPTSSDSRSCWGATPAPSNHAVKRYHGDAPSGHAVNRYHGDVLSSQVMGREVTVKTPHTCAKSQTHPVTGGGRSALPSEPACAVTTKGNPPHPARSEKPHPSTSCVLRKDNMPLCASSRRGLPQHKEPHVQSPEQIHSHVQSRDQSCVKSREQSCEQSHDQSSSSRCSSPAVNSYDYQKSSHLAWVPQTAWVSAPCADSLVGREVVWQFSGWAAPNECGLTLVIASEVCSPGKIWLQRTVNVERDLGEISHCIRNMKPSQLTSTPSKGDVCCARVPKTSDFRRVRITDLKLHTAPQKQAVVQYIDTGTDHVVIPLTHLHTLPSPFFLSSLPPLAHLCTMWGVVSTSTHGQWWELDSQLLRKLVYRKQVYARPRGLDDSTGKEAVDLFLDPDGIHDIADILVRDGDYVAFSDKQEYEEEEEEEGNERERPSHTEMRTLAAFPQALGAVGGACSPWQRLQRTLAGIEKPCEV